MALMARIGPEVHHARDAGTPGEGTFTHLPEFAPQVCLLVMLEQS